MDRLCKGLWIPTDLWESTLSWEAKILFIEIDSRTCEGKDLPLSISDIADFLCVSKSKAKEAISSLISIGKVVRTRKEKEVSYYQSCPLFASVAIPNVEIHTQSSPKQGTRQEESLTERRAKFQAECNAFAHVYGDKMVSEFFDYWAEADRSMRKMRFEKQPTWETKRRMDVWAKKENIQPRAEQRNVSAGRSFDEIFGIK